MIWHNPWAWLGLATLAVPVLIHLLGRRSARTQRFPTLRFLDASPLMATRRTRLTDLPLLAVRLGILGAAVAALAAPLVLTANRERELGTAAARAIIVDTSASMGRAASVAGGVERVIDVARREASRLAADARTSVVLETPHPASAIAGAAAWLAGQPGRRELVVVSDFQAGTIDSVDLAAAPSEIGIDFVRLEPAAATEPEQVVVQRGASEIVARVVASTNPAGASGAVGAQASPDSVGASGASAATTRPVTVEWSLRPAASPSDTGRLTIVAGASERPLADAAARAALATVAIPVSTSTDRPIAIIHRGFEGREQLVRKAVPLTAAWQGDVVARLHRDPALATASSMADVSDQAAADSIAARAGAPGSAGASRPSDAPASGGAAVRSGAQQLTVVARTRDGEPVVLTASDRVADRDRLLLFVQAGAGSLASAALVAAVMRAASPAVRATELSSASIPDATLATWRRPAASATSTRTADDAGISDGRWFWLLVLVLIGVEWWMRRERRSVQATATIRVRAA